MRTLALTLCALVGAAHAVVAQSTPTRDSRTVTARTARGLITMTKLGSTWMPCDGEGRVRPRDVNDQTGGDLAALYRALSGTEARPVYMELRVADGGHRDGGSTGPLTVLAVRRASPMDSRACNESWRHTELRARGNEPFWQLSVAGSVLSIMRPGMVPVHVGPVQVTVEGASRVYRAVTRSRKVEMHVTERRCVDGMSGEQFALAAEANIDGTIFKGCAAEPPDDLPEALRASDLAGR